MSFSNPKLIEAIPQAVLEKLPAAAPPVGVVPNFADPATRVPVILGISITFFVLAVVCFMIRIYTRIAIKNWRWDDLTCALGFVSMTTALMQTKSEPQSNVVCVDV